MNSRSKKTITWCFILVAYALMVTAVYRALQTPDMEGMLAELAADSSWSLEDDRPSLLIDKPWRADLRGAVLLPVTDEETSLPGLPEIWQELASAQQQSAATLAASGFHAMQAIEGSRPFPAGWSEEIFLGGNSLEAIRYGNHLLVLTSQNLVRVISCDDPLQPRLQASLPYKGVRQMAERDGLLYLLLGNARGPDPQLVVVSLADVLVPQEVARHDLPNRSLGFFLEGEHAVILQQHKGRLGVRMTELVVQRLPLTEGARLEPLGSVSIPLLGDEFLRYGDYLILNELRKGLRLVNYHHPSRSDLGATLTLAEPVKQMVLSGARLYVHGHRGSVSVIDLTDPLRPRLIVKTVGGGQVASLMFFGGATYYFRNMHLLVYDRPPGASEQRQNLVPFVATGALLPRASGEGVALLGEAKGRWPQLVGEVLPLPEASSLSAVLPWRGQWLVLRKSGLLQAYQHNADGEALLMASLQLPSGQRWLQRSAERLYVGGGREILVIAADVEGRLAVTGRLALPVEASWDAAVFRQTLWLAAGPAGLLAFSLADPDRPVVREMPAPGPLAGLVDARQLAVAEDGRVFAAAGQAGLLCFGITNDGLVRFCERLNFQGPVVAVAVVAGVCLAATASEVHVIDAATPHSVQKWGSVALSRVERFVAAPPQHWAALIKGVGWVFLPAPIRLVSVASEAADRHKLVLPETFPAGTYRAILYNDAGIRPVEALLEIKPPEGAISGVDSAAF